MDHYLLLAVAEDCPPGLTPILLDPCSIPHRILAEPPGELPPRIRRRLSSPCLEDWAREWSRAAAAAGLGLVTPDHEDFPFALLTTPLRPNLLFAKGDLSLLNRPGRLTMIGSRTPTPYGVAAAEEFGAACARAGVVLWSGLAYGIDAIAHRQALAAGCPTVAVLAGGLDRIYPAPHAELAAEIVAKGGLLLSEAPCGRRALNGHFPRRNRILAGASEAVLVIEAGQKSGTLHTARFAAEYGTEVFALPGPYQSPRSAGCHSLINEGAMLAASPSDLLRDLGLLQARHLPCESGEALAASADAEAILARIAHQCAGPR